MHQTNSIDYAVVISGAIEMELDDDIVVKTASNCWSSAGPSTTVIVGRSSVILS